MSPLTMALLLLATGDDPIVARFIDENLTRTPTNTVAPPYPRKARRDRIEGEVTVCFEIDRKGRPRRIAVRSSTGRQFEKPARKAVRQSRFAPLADDEPLPSIKTCRTFIFALLPLEDEEF